MSLDRNHPVFVGHPSRDRTPPRFRSRFLDDEIGSRTFRWRYRRYICIMGDQNSGRRSLAKRFFQDRGELWADGNWWLRGRIPLTNTLTRGELDLLIRIVPSPEEVAAKDNRILILAGMHGNAALFIFAFACARMLTLRSIEFLMTMFSRIMVRNLIPGLVVGTKSDLRPTDAQAQRMRYMSEEAIRRDIQWFFRPPLRYWYRRSPPYVECSVLNNENVDTVLEAALDIIIT